MSTDIITECQVACYSLFSKFNDIKITYCCLEKDITISLHVLMKACEIYMGLPKLIANPIPLWSTFYSPNDFVNLRQKVIPNHIISSIIIIIVVNFSKVHKS